MAKSSKGKIGGWAFLIGVILAVVLGVFMTMKGLTSLTQGWVWVLVVIGLVVGFLNVSAEEASHFLMSGAILVIVSAFGSGVLKDVTILANIMTTLLTVFIPATIIVAIKNVFSLARN